jgi:hypothetical protein
MHGIRVSIPVDRVFQTEKSRSYPAIIEAKDGPIFLELQANGLRIFVSSNEEVVDIDQPLSRPWYDVKDHFLSAVPLLMYLKWAFRDVCWKPNEAGACLIIDDPVLKLKYGFCDFRELDDQMREHDFATSIAVIPWNWRRTSRAMAELIRDSGGRLSVSVHGCDHTGAEFGSKAVFLLDSKAALAKARMERHRARTEIAHDLIMVFPQGVFSLESLSALQRHEFLAAVNTEVFPSNPAPEPLTISDMWSPTLTRFGSFPFFVRRYPAHGLENFAFDLLLGKPCLIVEHHKFFKDHGEQAISFVERLNSLNCDLKWRGLGEVLKRCYHWRMNSEGTLQVRMFASELLLRNESNRARNYEISKAEDNSVQINAVLANGQPIPWKSAHGYVTFAYEIPAGRDVAFQVRYPSSQSATVSQRNVNGAIKTAARRYLSELRDNYLSRHEGLLQLAQKTKRLIS